MRGTICYETSKNVWILALSDNLLPDRDSQNSNSRETHQAALQLPEFIQIVLILIRHVLHFPTMLLLNLHNTLIVIKHVPAYIYNEVILNF